MIRFVLIALLTIALNSSCSSDTSGGAESLQGIWKSNALKTLESMNSIADVTPPAREIFEAEFFGHLYVEFRGNNVRYWLDDEDFDTGFTEYELLDESESRVIIRGWDSVLEESVVDTLTFEDDCYKVVTSAFEFNEYFCRVPEDS